MPYADFILDTIAGNLHLLPQKAVYVPATHTLLLADLHLGKTQHFRKHGLAIPAAAKHRDHAALHHLLSHYHPAEVFFLGDLFHSHHNHEWELLQELLLQYPATKFSLVPGNHDILQDRHYSAAGLHITPPFFIQDRLLLSHEPLAEVPGGLLNIYGHIHPGYLLRGKGKQALHLPCFVKEMNSLLLPAFGAFTGLVAQTSTTASYYLVMPDRVLAV